MQRKFRSRADCIRCLEQVRWQGRPQCPYCGARGSIPATREYRHRCKRCFVSFSVTVGTPFHNSKIDIRKWFLCVHLVLATGKPPASRVLAKRLRVNKNTAWFMRHRIVAAYLQERQLFETIRTNL